VAIVDVAPKTIALEVVRCGCALGGKTTNLITLHKLTDPAGEKGLVSIATMDDRPLSFDLLPIDLRQIGALTVAAKVDTVPGQTYHESTRRQVLAGADGVAIVIDSDLAQRQANAWSIDSIRIIPKNHGFDRDEFPTVLQRNKQDLPSAPPVDVLEAAFDHRKISSNPAVAVTGAGVVDTVAFAQVAPLSCDSVLFGSVDVYGSFGEPLFDEAETSFWNSVASLVALALHCRARRKKMASSESANRDSGAGVPK